MLILLTLVHSLGCTDDSGDFVTLQGNFRIDESKHE